MWGSKQLAFIRMTEQEYRANINGMNIFFGAVLGVVMADAQTLRPEAFAYVLFLTATLVITILYVSTGRQRLFYIAIAALGTAALPRLIEEISTGTTVPDNLQPTLGVWLAMTVLVEFIPRERAAPSSETSANT